MMKMPYQVSVVTPFHNIDMPMFEKCAESMRAQTIGFENVQWIIVVHNCQPDYLPQLQEMFRDDDNVELRVLDNEARTPSSPRNYGSQFVAAPYVGYLDGDDKYLPNTLEVALHEGLDTDSDIVWFRRELEFEKPGMSFPTASVLWNNTRRRIVVEYGDWKEAEMFEGSFGFVTNNLFRSEFLREKKLAFNENVHFAEDALFMVHALAKAQRICYLPQLIGYRYFVNAASLVQQSKKSVRELIDYAKGFRTLYDAMRSYGMDPREYIQLTGVFEARFILISEDLTVEDRQTIKDILGPDVIATQLLPPGKSYSAEERRSMLHLLQDVILNPENPGAEYLKNTTNGLNELGNILLHNADTDMGHSYNFAKLDLRAYRNRVPLSDTESYRPLIDLQTRVGEFRILTVDPIVCYLTSSDGELTPVTERQSKKYAECLGETLKGRQNILFARSHPVSAHTRDGAVVDTLGSAIVKDYFSRVHLKEGIPLATLTSPLERYYSISAAEDDFFDLMTEALSSTDADQLVAFTAKDLLSAMQTLERDWRKMVEQMPAGQRRDEVEHILSCGFDSPVVPQLWPSLQRVVCFGAGKMSEAMGQLRRYIGHLPHNHGYDYLKSAVMGKALADDSDLFECIKEHCFYEFIPVDSASQQTLVWSELEMSKAYRVVITNHAGLYRYLTNHIICPQEVTPTSIKFTIV